jgi:alkanesulfonate monooxygenase SsuD/methylene tetrahydromethanopterin reductase-like flavin-dependent oxidoreductase (luciferase family)
VLKIGVLLPGRFSDAGDFLADARALDAAGVDSLWLPGDGLDPWLVLAGIASVTGRARLAMRVSARDAADPDALARRLDTLARLSRGRVLPMVVAGPEPAGTEALIACARGEGRPVLMRADGGGPALLAGRLADGLVAAEEPARCHATFDQVRDRRARDRQTAPFELWTHVARPAGRDAWRGALTAAAAVGATGVVVPLDPRLLDLVRNDDEDEDRSDLTLAQG